MQKLRLIERVYESYYRHECLGLCTMNIKQGYKQTAIANILSDMDAEISQLEGRRAKMGELKQGMMQELLTGRIRLI